MIDTGRKGVLLVMLFNIGLTACHNGGKYDAAKEDTIGVLNVVLESPVLDSVLTPYHDSTMKIMLNKSIKVEYPISWRNKKVQYIERSEEALNYDTTGMPQKFNVEFGRFRISNDSADVIFGFRNYGIEIRWLLTKKQERWTIDSTRWGMQ